ncbi:MAG TPA: OmpA family protein [Bacteroidia bacterium]|jgi:outer membrane protein OmpA-like peptidoglycan-associated protein
MRKFNYSIPSPCLQDFSKMKKDEKGRFCESCAKHVIDFSKKREPEIQEYLYQNQDKEICGTFANSQLNQRNQAMRNRFSFGFIGVVIVAFFSNLLVSCRVYKPRGGAIVFDTTGGRPQTTETVEDHLMGIRKTCPPEKGPTSGPVVTHRLFYYFKKDSIFGKDTISTVVARTIPDRTSVHFESNEHALHSNERTILEAFAEELKNYPELSVVIEGHTDGTGTSKRNKTISLKRAEAVKNFFLEKGLKNTIKTEAYGTEKPVADNDTKEGKAKNRRAEIQLID